MKPLFFATAEELGAWLERTTRASGAAGVGFYKKGSGQAQRDVGGGGRAGAALRLDRRRAAQRGRRELHEPRSRPASRRSNWSLINVAKVEELKQRGLMAPAGLRAYEARTPERTGVYSGERDEAAVLPAEFERRLRANGAACGVVRGAPARLPPHRDALGGQREARGDPAAPPPAADRLLGGGAHRAAAGAMNRPPPTLVR